MTAIKTIIVCIVLIIVSVYCSIGVVASYPNIRGMIGGMCVMVGCVVVFILMYKGWI